MSAKGHKGGNQHTVDDRLDKSGNPAAPLATRRKSHPADNTTFREFERRIPRNELISALAASADPRAVSLSALMTDYVLGRQSLPTLARRAGLGYVEVLRLLTDSRLQAGLLAMSEHVPAVLEDAAIDAKSKRVPCQTCRGTGKLTTAAELDDSDLAHGIAVAPTQTTTPCWACEGSGKLRRSGDKEARKLVFESLGLTNQGKAMVNIDNRTVQVASVEDDLAAAGRVIDAKAAE